LYVRLILALLGPLLLAMAAAWAIGVGIVTRTLEQRVEGQLRNAVAVLAGGGLPMTPDLLKRLASLQQSDLVLLDRHGRVSIATADDVGRAIEASLASGKPWSRDEPQRLDTPQRSLALYHPFPDGVMTDHSALVAVAPLADADRAAAHATRWLGFAMVTATIVLGAVLLLLVRSITRPLSELSRLADRIAAGERNSRVDLGRADEIGALAEALNSMMERLRSYEDRLASQTRLSALGQMSAKLAHEIRNPLTGLKLHLQLMAERNDAPDPTRVARLLSEVQRLELLVASTLTLGVDRPLDIVDAPLADLIGDVLELMAPSLAHRGIVAERHCDDRLRAPVDRDRLRQALLNLIVNAADAMPEGGRLRIRTEPDAASARVRILVEDSGPGVVQPAGERAGASPASTKPFGLGLGLTVCRDVAAAHGGELRIERSAELGGACFVIVLPVVAATAGVAAVG
jgi:signal transduction histidine kinase